MTRSNMCRNANCPSYLLEIIVVCHADDLATIAEAQRLYRPMVVPKVNTEKGQI